MVNPNQEKSSKRIYMIVFSTYLYSFTNDAAISWASPVLPILRNHYDPAMNPLGYKITVTQESWLGSLPSLGNVVGLLPYGYLCYKFGRKYTLASLGILHTIAFLLFLTTSLECFYIGRFLNGLAYGAGAIVFPMYIAEICKDSDRGFLVASRQIFSSCGTLFSFFMGNHLPMFWFNSTLIVFPLLFVISFLILATESPYFYTINQDFTAARSVCVELTTSEKKQQIDEDVDEMKRAVEMSEMSNDDLTDGSSQKHVIVIIYAFFVFQHLTGYVPIVTYSEIIMEQANAGYAAGNMAIFAGVMFLIGSTISTLFIDKKGRKILLYISLSGVIISTLTFSFYYFFFSSYKILPLISLVSFFLFYSIGLALLPQIICAELLPINIKFKVASTAGVLGYGTAFLLTKNFLHLNRTLGPGWIMLSFAGSALVFLVLIVYFFPETKGKSFRQIQSMLEQE